MVSFVGKSLIIGSFCVFSMSNAMAFVTYGGIFEEAKKYYHASDNKIIWFANIFSFPFMLFVLPAVWLLNIHFLHGMLLGNCLNTLGIALRFFGGHNYTMAFLGQFFSASSQAFVLATPSIITIKFFVKSEQFITLLFTINANYLGNSIGYFIGPLVTRGHSHRMTSLLGYHFYFSLGSLILAFVLGAYCWFFEKRVVETYKDPTFPIIQSIKDAIKFRSFIYSVFFLAIPLCLSWVLTVLLQYMLKERNFKPIEFGYIGLCFTLSGLVASIVASFLEKAFRHDGKFLIKCIRINIFLSFASLLSLCFCMYWKMSNELIMAVSGLPG